MYVANVAAKEMPPHTPENNKNVRSPNNQYVDLYVFRLLETGEGGGIRMGV
jgi:hypothetical protein